MSDMKLITFFGELILLVYTGHSQTPVNSGTNLYYNSPLWGIGIPSPQTNLHIGGHVAATLMNGTTTTGFVQLWADNALSSIRIRL